MLKLVNDLLCGLLLFVLLGWVDSECLIVSLLCVVTKCGGNNVLIMYW